MKKEKLITLIASIVSIVAIAYAVIITVQRNSAIIQYEEMKDLYDSTNKELLNYKMNPDKLKQEAYLAFKKEDDEEIKRVIELLEKYHIETLQCTEVKGYLTSLEEIREQRRLAEKRKKEAEERRKEAERIAKERNFKFDIGGIKLGMSRSAYNSLISKLKSSGKLRLYDEGLYSMYWFSSNRMVEIKSYGANSPYDDTFASYIDYDIILHSKPIFTDGQLSSIEVLVSPIFGDNVIVGSTKNIDLLRDYLINKFDQSPTEKDNSYCWNKNNQSVVLEKTRYADWGGLIYYKLKLTR
ncbi:MAG: hypothetical protein IKL60_00585 [Alistipes sp.]|nr:hypothetical protein [Alistipes sp.]